MTRCDICNKDYKNIYLHNKTEVHQKKAGVINIIKPKKYNYDNIKEYHKEYQKQHYQKIKEVKIKCDICDKMINKCNLSHHKQTKKHKIKSDDNLLFEKNVTSSYSSLDEIEIEN